METLSFETTTQVFVGNFNEHSYHVTFGFNLRGGFRGEDYI